MLMNLHKHTWRHGLNLTKYVPPSVRKSTFNLLFLNLVVTCERLCLVSTVRVRVRVSSVQSCLLR
jgi:hypothetical protein